MPTCRVLKRLLFPAVLLVLGAGACSTALGQVVVSQPLDVLAGLRDGSVQASIEPAPTKGTAETIFDGNHLTECGVTADSLLEVTLEFSNAQTISQCKLFFFNAGHWSLETAQSREDLDSHSGTYDTPVHDRSHSAFAWDSLSFSPTSAKLLRLTARNPETNMVLIGEWSIQTSVTMVALFIRPQPLKLIPGTSTQLRVELLDEQGTTHPYTLAEHVSWSSSNPDVATVGEMGDVHAHAVGTTVITAFTSALSGSTTAEVLPDFTSPRAETITAKVALVLQDPIIDFVNKRRIHQVRGWADPHELVAQIREELSRASHGVVRFEIVESHNDPVIFTRLDGEFMTIDTVAYYYSSLARLYGRNTEGTLQNLAEVQGRVRFDYNAMIDYYDFASKRNADEITEVWVYAPPFAGMYESQLVGPNAFWYNSPPLDHPGLQKLLPIMGWNYERGVAEALHSFGHRSESAMVQAYGGRWNVFAKEPTPWEIYTRIDKDFPGGAHVGNIHYPPNGMGDYDYSNHRIVITYADNWKRYPILLDQTREINCEEWDCTQLGYMRWWFGHLPHFKGQTDGVLNNWWYYIVDFETAVKKAAGPTRVHPQGTASFAPPSRFSLDQNYPNPFNPVTHIQFTLPSRTHVRLLLYDSLGRQVEVLVDDYRPPGRYVVPLDASDLPSGLYLYRLTAGPFDQARKLLVLK